jgi:hypothetical protein
VDDPALLDYEGVQIVLLGARVDHVEEELGIEIDEKKEIARSAEVFRTLKLRREEVRTGPLLRGEFPAREMPIPGEEVEHLAGPPAPRRAGRVERRSSGTEFAARSVMKPSISARDTSATARHHIRAVRRRRRTSSGHWPG